MKFGSINIQMGHLKEQGETYWQHFRCAVKFAIVLLLLSVVCLIHALIPNILTTTASDRLQILIKEMQRCKDETDPIDPYPESKTPKD